MVSSISLSNGLLPYGTKPLLKAMKTNCQLDKCENMLSFHKNMLQPMTSMTTSSLRIHIYISLGNGLLLYGTKPLLKTMKSICQLDKCDNIFSQEYVITGHICPTPQLHIMHINRLH